MYFVQMLNFSMLKTWKEQEDRTAGVPPPGFCAACHIITSGEKITPEMLLKVVLQGFFGLSTALQSGAEKGKRRLQRLQWVQQENAEGKGVSDA